MERTKTDEPRAFGVDGELLKKVSQAVLKEMQMTMKTYFDVIMSCLKEKSNPQPPGQSPTYNNCHDFFVAGAFSTVNYTKAGNKEDKKPKPKFEEALLVEEKAETRELPDELRSEAALALLGKFQHAGMLDENYQPVNLSRAFKAVLANTIGEELRLKRKWTTFERLWDFKALASAYTKAMNQDNVVEFIKKIDKVIK